MQASTGASVPGWVAGAAPAGCEGEGAGANAAGVAGGIAGGRVAVTE